jgi:hypothetical protein
VQSDMDPSLWLIKDDTGAVVAIYMFYVDDGLVAALEWIERPRKVTRLWTR